MGNYKTLNIIGNAAYERKKALTIDQSRIYKETTMSIPPNPWSRQNWLGDILIIVSLYIRLWSIVNALFRSYAALSIKCKVLLYGGCLTILSR